MAEIHERQTKECEESLQKKYAAAWEEEAERVIERARRQSEAEMDEARAKAAAELAAAKQEAEEKGKAMLIARNTAVPEDSSDEELARRLHEELNG